MKHWWSLAFGEVALLVGVAAGGVGLLAAHALGMSQVGAAFLCVGATVLALAAAQLIARGRWDLRVPAVSLGAMVVVGFPLLLAWWGLAWVLGLPTSWPSPAYLFWFVSGVLLARILARLTSAFAARKTMSANPSAVSTNAQR